ncbi:PREDICTED: inositol-pentakisphosphate [Prunus dulcis]|uniref:Inositol-pentakisphosphate 2-kinase n=1 Tax=Prunus dulcis TaxID=3755 RepID=A0A5E4EV96_PRUDU|nr:inositol-pentakisphosphate 2-kinase-like [Prunus dulcis]XP_034196973.1 inositol-pentakisphosphate 2-kinase-like [Prunus dulcis]VVA19687.1 PREDICTED: inositol-pentakisphosphate [Prunus dulcis]
MEVALEKKDAADWVYRGEGAANLVLGYSGSAPAFIGKVMRLQKAPINGSKSMNSPTELTMHERLLWKDTEDIVATSNKELACQLFVKHIMSPLLGSTHVDSGMRVPASKEFLESVEKNIICQRPASRVDAAKVDTQCDSVLLMSDHSIFPRGTQEVEPCISVEIKPKCGFLPSSKFIDEGNAIKRSVTRFRMHQALKLHQGEVSEYSEYNPLDLFSGSKDRIHKAIRDLFSTPQNNFRVFLNGSQIFGGLGGGADSTDFVTRGKFEDALKCVIQGGDGLRTMSFLLLVAETVHKSGVLDRLLEVQKLDNLDIDGAIHAYYDIVSEPCRVCRASGKEKISQRYLSLHSISLDESLKIVKDFLIAATAKDCSLMISFRPRKDGNPGSPYNNLYLDSTKQFFDYKVNFIDLDLKQLKKMEEYYELDKKIVTYYNRMVETEERQKKNTSTMALRTAN